MLIIRLQRTGRRNLPTYRIVVAEKSRAVKGKFLEIVGTFLPNQDKGLTFQEERIKHWMGKGAGMSNTTARLLSRAGVQGLEKYILRYTKRKPKGEEGASESAAAPSVVGGDTAARNG